MELKLGTETRIDIEFHDVIDFVFTMNINVDTHIFKLILASRQHLPATDFPRQGGVLAPCRFHLLVLLTHFYFAVLAQRSVHVFARVRQQPGR